MAVVRSKCLTLLTIAAGLISAAALSLRFRVVDAQVPSVKTSHDFLNVPYGPILLHGANLLDLRLPVSGQPPFPLIVYIHGGGWTSGDKSMFPNLLLNSKGYATASINYRLASKNKFPAQIIDCKSAISWLRSHASSMNLDASRIGVWGASAGGHLAALVGTTGDAQSPAWASPTGGVSNKVDAVVDWCGPSDLITLNQGTPPKQLTAAVKSFLGALPSDRPDLAKEASPITYAHKGCPPFLIMHGDRDPLIPISQSQELIDALKNKGVDCTYEFVKGGAHQFYSAENEAKIIAFFNRALKIKR